jgi:hypothetical protein
MSSSVVFSSTQVTVQSRNKKVGSIDRKSTTSSQPRATSLTELYKATKEIRSRLEERSQERRPADVIKDASPLKQKLHFEPANILRHHVQSKPLVDHKKITHLGPRKF